MSFKVKAGVSRVYLGVEEIPVSNMDKEDSNILFSFVQ